MFVASFLQLLAGALRRPACAEGAAARHLDGQQLARQRDHGHPVEHKACEATANVCTTKSLTAATWRKDQGEDVQHGYTPKTPATDGFQGGYPTPSGPEVGLAEGVRAPLSQSRDAGEGPASRRFPDPFQRHQLQVTTFSVEVDRLGADLAAHGRRVARLP